MSKSLSVGKNQSVWYKNHHSECSTTQQVQLQWEPWFQIGLDSRLEKVPLSSAHEVSITCSCHTRAKKVSTSAKIRDCWVHGMSREAPCPSQTMSWYSRRTIPSKKRLLALSTRPKAVRPAKGSFLLKYAGVRPSKLIHLRSISQMWLK